MQHINGNMSQTVNNDLGPFITVGNYRFRRDCLFVYFFDTLRGDDGTIKNYRILFSLNNSTQHVFCHSYPTETERNEDLKRLDKIYEIEKESGLKSVKMEILEDPK